MIIKEWLKHKGGLHSSSSPPPPIPILLLLSLQVSQLHFRMFDYHVSIHYKMVHNGIITHMFPTMTEQKYFLCIVTETK